MKNILLSLSLFVFGPLLFAQTYTVSGYVKEKGTQEALLGVNVYDVLNKRGSATNTYGFYSLTLAATDTLSLRISSVGFSTQTRKIYFRKNQILNIELESDILLEELEVKGERIYEKVTETPRMSTIDVPVNQIKKIPTLLGEKDVLKVLQLLPGVQKASEGQSGVYVRGGGPDQNLIILDDATVYNASHLFGFFSTFNGDALKSVELVKGGFPARYGGRLSSVIEMNLKDGNRQKISGEAGVGIISSRLLLEGPIKIGGKKRASFVVSGRRTYADVLSKPFLAAQNKNSAIKQNGSYFFYDLNAKLNYDLDPKNKLYLSGYFGRDVFGFDAKSADFESANGIAWGNATGTLRWNHQYTQKLFANTSLIFSDYKFNIYGNQKTQQGGINNVGQDFELQYISTIRDFAIKHDIDFYPNPKHTLKIGLSSIRHRFLPDATIIREASTSINLDKRKLFYSQESGIYIEDTYKISPKVLLNVGLRLSHYATDSLQVARPEPRFSLALNPKQDLSFKISYASMNQYLHLLSNTGLGLPTDLWVPATKKVKPQKSSQWAVGVAKDLPGQRGFALSVEAYHKDMRQLINYKEGASFLQLGSSSSFLEETSWESKVTSGQGTSYGLEVLLQKKLGRLSGWTGYTWSKTEWQFDELNFGEKFFPKYDRRHDASVVLIYELKKSITLSGTWVYGTGNALTVPKGEYLAYSTNLNYNLDNTGFRGGTVSEYGAKNSFRAEAYHRLDLGLQFHKKKKRFERTWDISIYNAYNRKNPFFYTVGAANSVVSLFGGNFNSNQTQNTTLALKRYSLFPVIPSITYGIKF